MFNYSPLAVLMKERKMSLKDISDMTGLSESVLRCKMNENAYIGMEALDKLCGALGVEADKIIQWQEGICKGLRKYYVNWDFIIGKSIEKGLSLNMLSEKCRLNKSSLWYAKKRNTQLKHDVVKDIVKILGCKLDDVILPVGSADAEK